VVAGDPDVSSRDEVLGRIRSALRDVPRREAPDDVEVPRLYRVAGDGSDPVEAFAARVEEYRAEVHRVDAESVAASAGRICESAGVRTLVVPAGIAPEWLPREESR
jgi:L-lactate dehydrogenase complex protein LldG